MTNKEMIEYLRRKERKYYYKMIEQEENCRLLKRNTEEDKLFNKYSGAWVAIYEMLKDLGVY